MLFRHETNFDVISVSWEVIFTIVLLTVGFFSFAIGAGIRAQRRKPTTGIQGLIGEHGTALSDLSPDGEIKVHGEIWKAHSPGDSIPKGTSVIVVGMEKLTLVVKQEEH